MNASSSTLAGQLAAHQALEVLLRGLLDRRVVRQVVVVLGEALVDLDRQAQRVGDRLAGLQRRAAAGC